ncbi:MAG: glycosyltransferase family 39 protein [Candidatus Pacebacteria bacterium]|nr:glycosyltransferase family 39 protein [Candidatus Paceibacterota bacterium]
MYYALIGILVAGLLLRLAGVVYGLPLDLLGDEFAHIVASFSFLNEMTLRSLSPLVYVPSLMGVLITPFIVLFGGIGMVTGMFVGVAGFKEFAILHASEFLSVGRVISALFGVGFIYLIYLLARPLAGRWPALIAAGLASADFWLVHESHKAHFWIPAVTLVALAFYLLIKMAESGRVRYYWSSVATIALAFWMGFFPIIVAPFFLLAFIHSRVRRFSHFLYAGTFFVALIGLIGWLNPLSVVRQFGRAIRSALNAIGLDVFPQFVGPSDKATEPLENLYFLLRTLFWDNPFVFVLGALGLGFMLYKLSWRSFTVQLLFGFFALYLCLATFVWPHPDHRYMLPLLIPLLIGTAYILSALYEKFKTTRWVMPAGAVVLVVVFSYSLYVTLRYDALMLKPDTRILAREWVFEHVPDGAGVYTDARYFDLPKSKDSIIFYSAELPTALRTKDEVALTLQGDAFPRPAYFVVDSQYVSQLGNKTPRYSYIVAGFSRLEERMQIPAGFTLVQTYYPQPPQEPLDDLLLAPNHIFTSVGKYTNLGPHIEIYKRVE